MSEVFNKHSRLPRKFTPQPESKPEDAPKRNIVHSGKLEKANPLTVLKRYLTEESPAQIAESYGVTTHALNLFLIKNAEEAWRDAHLGRALSMKQNAQDAIDAAKDPLALAKARELLKAAQWDLERLGRSVYGQEVSVNVGVMIDHGERLRRARERVLEHEQGQKTARTE